MPGSYSHWRPCAREIDAQAPQRRFLPRVCVVRARSLLLFGLFALSIALHGQTDSSADDGRYVPEIARQAAAEGSAAFARADFEGARRAYLKVIDLAPDNLLGLINLGVVEYSLKKFEEAEGHLKHAVRLKLDAAPAWLTLGIIYLEQNRLDEALAALAQATLYDPRNARARNYLGVVVGRKGWIDGAQVELRRAVEIDPNYSDAHYNLAVFYLEGRPPSIELARRHYFRAIELGADPDPEIEQSLKAAAPSPSPSPTAKPAAKSPAKKPGGR
jgi:tetratricopeptide (TPR) repeat protein